MAWRFLRSGIAFPLCVAMALATDAVAQGSGGAQLFDGMGSYSHPIRTSSPEAQRYFDQGLALLYNFNHAEAERSFLKAAELDPKAPMPWWGVGIALGLNYNRDVTKLEGERGKRAYDAAQKAVALSRGGAPIEAALADALVLRYALDPAVPPDLLNAKYHDAMKAVHQKFPDDADVAVMYADAMMNLRPWQLWAADGTPAPDTLELVALLESVLRRRPDHPGANHYYIHAVEASPTPERALTSAERLLTLVPGAGHLVHMPSHIYMHTGDFAKMATLNEQAAAVDEAYIAKANPESVYPFMYYGHNVHFAMFAHMLAGRFAPARAQADKLAALASPHVHEMAAMAEWTLTLTTLIDVRFQKWDRVLAAPAPDATLPLVTAIDQFARATAHARGNRLVDARRHAEQFEAARAMVPAETMFVSWNPATAVLAIASDVLKAELAADAASRIPFLRDAVAKQDALRYDEPPPWCVSLRESLGVALLQAGRAADAEAVFREDLRRNPGSGRTLFGLMQSLDAQARPDEAQLVKHEFDEAWKHADGPLTLDALR
jgi:tetratricopeptide (TPR) repeat protein